MNLEEIKREVSQLSEPDYKKFLKWYEGFTADQPEGQIEELLTNNKQDEDETAYLLQEPTNASRLLESVENLKLGCNIEQRELLPDE